MSAAAGMGRRDAPANPRSRSGLDAVRREFRRSRRPATPERWRGDRLRKQLPRVALGESLEILLGWRGQPGFEPGAVTWHARLAGHVPGLTLGDAEQALRALRELGGPCPEPAAFALRALCTRHRLGDVALVLDEWLAQRQSYGGF
jgi:hypothetical protein